MGKYEIIEVIDILTPVLSTRKQLEKYAANQKGRAAPPTDLSVPDLPKYGRFHVEDETVKQ
jgi:hypothetical protein